MSRRHILSLAAAAAFFLIAGSEPRLIGDGSEYMAQAMNFASGRGPSFAPADLPDIQRRIADIDPRRGKWRMERSLHRSGRGGYDFVHFWFYGLLAAPALVLTDVLRAPATMAFTAVNLAVLGVALWLALPRIGALAALLLFAGPVVWFIDKPHTEAFTFGLLAIAYSLLPDRPWWSLVALGAAATQNPPISAAVGIAAVAAAWGNPGLLKDRRFIAGAAAGLALALLHPAYTYARHGTGSLLLDATKPGLPTAAEASVVVLDPNLGLVGNYPLFLVVVGAALVTMAVRNPRRLHSPDMLAAAGTAVVFMFSFAQTTNLHHGGTPSFSRYVIWLAPLSIPLLSHAAAHGRRAWQLTAGFAAVSSAIISVVAFRPGVRENAREPTWLATWVWTKAPGWHNPVPETFIEALTGVERYAVPVSTPRCEKVLIAGYAADEGVWPIPCYPQAASVRCRTAGTLCYANRDGPRYDFVRAPGRPRIGAPATQGWTWPTAAEPFVRQLYDGWGWHRLAMRPEGLAILEEAREVRVAALGGDDQFVLVVGDIGDEAALKFRPKARALRGAFVDPLSGRTVEATAFTGEPGALWDVVVPQGYQLLLLAARSADP
jgi:hypothetical protein